MATTKSATNRYQWPDGSWHSVPKGGGTTVINQPALAALLAGTNNAPTKGAVRDLPLPPPPVGSYDPSIDYNANASTAGLNQSFDDASTAFEQGQEDYGLAKGDLGTSRDRNLADLLTQRNDTIHQYGILGGQQAERAAQAGVTSQGLLAKSAAARAGNQAHDLAPIDLATSRTNEDYTRGLLGLDLQNSRTFGGLQGHVLNNPLTGASTFGSVATGLARNAQSDQAFQNLSAAQRTSSAAANNYIPPSLLSVTPGTRTSAAADFNRKRKAQGLIT